MVLFIIFLKKIYIIISIFFLALPINFKFYLIRKKFPRNKITKNKETPKNTLKKKNIT